MKKKVSSTSLQESLYIEFSKLLTQFSVETHGRILIRVWSDWLIRIRTDPDQQHCTVFVITPRSAVIRLNISEVKVPYIQYMYINIWKALFLWLLFYGKKFSRKHRENLPAFALNLGPCFCAICCNIKLLIRGFICRCNSNCSVLACTCRVRLGKNSPPYIRRG